MTPLQSLLLIAATAPMSQQVLVAQNAAVLASTADVMGRPTASPIKFVPAGIGQHTLKPETARQLVAAPREALAAPRPPSPSIQALDRLRKFESWGANWDGEGAPAPKAKALAAAANVLGLLEDEILQTPTVALNAAGEPTFVCMTGGKELSVTVRSPRWLAFYVAGQGTEEAGSARFLGESLPKRLVNALSAAGLA